MRGPGRPVVEAVTGLALRRDRRGGVVRAPLGVVAAGLGAVCTLVPFAYLAPLTPLDEQAAAPGTVVLDAHGALLQRDVSAGVRIPVRLDEVAAIAVAATVGAEDQRFWRHPGVDPLAIARAARDLPSRPSGASTITQQLARRLYLPADGADGSPGLLVHKGREAPIALQLEARHSKQELLEA